MKVVLPVSCELCGGDRVQMTLERMGPGVVSVDAEYECLFGFGCFIGPDGIDDFGRKMLGLPTGGDGELQRSVHGPGHDDRCC